MKWVVYAIFTTLYLLVTYFGLGPVLIADGSFQERMITLGIVVLIYFILTVILVLWIKKQRN